MYWIIDWRLYCVSENRNCMQRQSNNVMIQNLIFRIALLFIGKITIILVTDKHEFTSNCFCGK